MIFKADRLIPVIHLCYYVFMCVSITCMGLLLRVMHIEQLVSPPSQLPPSPSMSFPFLAYPSGGGSEWNAAITHAFRWVCGQPDAASGQGRDLEGCPRPWCSALALSGTRNWRHQCDYGTQAICHSEAAAATAGTLGKHCLFPPKNVVPYREFCQILTCGTKSLWFAARYRATS